MTKERIYEELQELQVKMRSIAESMMQYEDGWQMHAKQMLGAAKMIDDWLEGIEKEMEVDNDDK